MRAMRWLGVPVVLVALVACSSTGGEKGKQCRVAWQARLSAIDAASTSLDAAMATLTERDASAKAASAEVDKKLAELTVRYADRDSYAAKMKGVVGKAKMRLATMSAMKHDTTSTPLPLIRYDVEIQGDYRNVGKAVAALFDQPKAFQIDRVELNITDPYRNWSTIKTQGWVYEPGTVAAAAPDPLSAQLASALSPDAPAECEGVSSKELASLSEKARATLAARTADAEAARAVASTEAQINARKKLIEDLIHRRDDNKAVFTAHIDELVRRAKSSPAMLAELRFTAKGDPEWK